MEAPGAAPVSMFFGGPKCEKMHAKQTKITISMLKLLNFGLILTHLMKSFGRGKLGSRKIFLGATTEFN